VAPRSELTSKELAVLLAALRLMPKAYGAAILNEIQEASGRTLATATLYSTVERLADKGFISTRRGEPTPERGGRAKLYVSLTATGHTALQNELKVIDGLRGGRLAGGTA